MPYALRRPRLWYERSGDGEPLLLITAYTISSAVFDPLLELYEPRFDCIATTIAAVSRLGQIQAPTLVMQGERDAMSPMADARMLADRIPDAELAVVVGAGHAYALERPEESLELILCWLGSRLPIPAGAPRIGAAARGRAGDPRPRAAYGSAAHGRQPACVGGGQDQPRETRCGG